MADGNGGAVAANGPAVDQGVSSKAASDSMAGSEGDSDGDSDVAMGAPLDYGHLPPRPQAVEEGAILWREAASSSAVASVQTSPPLTRESFGCLSVIGRAATACRPDDSRDRAPATQSALGLLPRAPCATPLRGDGVLVAAA